MATDAHAFADFKSMITETRDDKSRLRLLKAWIGDHKVSCAQTGELLATFFGLGDTKVQAAVAAYPQIVDPAGFAALLQSAFKFEEERTDVRKRLGL
eukprot:m.37280 g.37280  ORF g.37280 m.37280 type:complete len:97 (+) comp5437_c0_seq1:1447-1737(+)